MTENNQEQGTAAPESNAGQETPQTPNKDEGTQFTQTQVNDIIEGRLAKLKKQYEDKFSDFDIYKSGFAELETVKKELSTLQEATANVGSADEIVKDVLDSMLEGVEETKRSLIPDSMSATEKIVYINKNKDILLSNAPNTPQTPPSDKGEEAPKGNYGDGKYTSLSEFSANDPAGYLKFRKSGGK